MEELQAKLLDILDGSTLSFPGAKDGGNIHLFADSLNAIQTEIQNALEVLRRGKMVETKDFFTWVITEEGRQELARLKQTPEGRKLLEADG